MQDPSWQVTYAYEGASLPAYAYALNNPLNVVDDTGLGPTPFGPTLPWDEPPSENQSTFPSIDPFDPEAAEEWLDFLNDSSSGAAGAGSNAKKCAAEHTKNARPSTWNKHTKKRAGAKEKKDDRMPYRQKNAKKIKLFKK